MKVFLKYSFFFFLFAQFSFAAFSQKETDKWYFNQFYNGSSAVGGAPALDFSSGSPVSVNNSASVNGWEGCASIADANGNLLFYTQGLSLYNKNHVITPNGSGLLGNNSVTQVAIFVPRPGSPNIYYLIILGDPAGNAAGPYTPWTLYWNEIDITLNGGLGDVTANKNVVIAGCSGNTSEKLAVAKHCNGTDYWLLAHTNTGNSFKAFLITAAGINTTPVVSSVGTVFSIGANGNDSQGQMKFSPNGTKLAIALKETHTAQLFDFNKSTGVVSNAITLGNFALESYGMEFSPNNSVLYATMSDAGGSTNIIVQWDLCGGVPTSAMNVYSIPTPYYSLQLASDGKIYGATYFMSGANSKLSVISSPNVMGAGYGFSTAGPSISPHTCGIGLPNFVSSYFDTPGTFSYATTSQVNATNCQNNGSATVNICATLGAAPFTYTWSNGTVIGPTTGLTSTISNIGSGTYSVVINDATCMKDTAFFSITGNSFSVTPTSTSTACGSSNGTASVNVSSGTPPYTYLWNPTSQTTSAVSGLAAGNYSVTITDNTGCSQTTVVNISSSGGGTVTITSQNVLCNGANNGSANATISSGTPPYIYNWSGGQTTQTAAGLSVGNYTCTVTDSGGCSSTQTISISQPSQISVSTSVTPTSCGTNIGAAAAGVAGGSPGYSYNWSNGQTSQNISGLAVGNYSVTITDANGCTQTAIANITSTNGPTATVSADVSINAGSSASLVAGGGTNYSWYSSAGLSCTTCANPVASPLVTTQYCVLVTDGSGCSDSACVTVFILPEPASCGELEFYFPNAFSPNDDNENDVFMNYIDASCISEFKLIIYNRWGEKVFETEDVTHPWNGEFRGVMSNPAVYAYYCKATLINGKEIEKKGNISLLK